jgi:dTDP-4-dehydrorhamnose 3,5-epimerase-like enzyme
MMKLADRIQIIDRRVIEDSRGYFLKVLTGKEDFLPVYTGEIYVTSAKPGEAKGGHYHPKANEWFTLIQGEAELKLVDILTGEKMQINLVASEPKTILVPNTIAHVFINHKIDSDFLLLAYSDQLFNTVDTIIWDKF